jgi:hypothetical protein
MASFKHGRETHHRFHFAQYSQEYTQNVDDIISKFEKTKQRR